MKKILFSNEFYELYRGDKDFIMPEAIRKAGYDVYLLAPNKISTYDEEAGYTYPSFLHQKMFPRNKISIYHAWRFVRKTHNKIIPFIIPNPFSYIWHLIRIKPDIIVESIYTTLTPRSFLNYFYAVLMKKKRILMDAGDEAANKRVLPFEKKAMVHASSIFSFSEGGINRMVQKYQMDSYPHFIWQQKALNGERFFYREISGNQPITIGYVGRLLQIKGFDKFLEIAEQLLSQGVKCRLVVAGVNQDNFEIPNYIDYRHYISPEQMGDLYREIDYLLLPDMNQMKSYATVIQEALLCGCHVVVGIDDISYFPDLVGITTYAPRNLEVALNILKSCKKADILDTRKRIASYYKQKNMTSDPIDLLKKTIQSISSD